MCLRPHSRWTAARLRPPTHGPGHSHSQTLGSGSLTCLHQLIQGWDWAEQHNSVLAPGDARGTAESPGPMGPLWGGVGERAGGRKGPTPPLHIHLSNHRLFPGHASETDKCPEVPLDRINLPQTI